MAWKNRNRIFLVAMLVSVAVLYNTFESKDFKKKVHRIKSIQEPPYISPSIYLPPRPITNSEQRLSNIKKQCADQKRDWNNMSAVERFHPSKHTVVDDKHRFLYCGIPKVATTNWKRVCMVLDGRANASDSIKQVERRRFKFLFHLSSSEIEHRLQTYYKFMFVREPLERLVSAYKDQILLKRNTATAVSRRYSNAIVQRHRTQQATQRQSSVNNNLNLPTLTEFFTYLTNVSLLDMNLHWMPYEQLCQPCAISYDFIGSLDNLQQDANRVLSHLGVQDKVQFPAKQRLQAGKQPEYFVLDNQSKNVSFDSLLSQVPRKLLDKIVEKYSEDYRLFSFPRPRFQS